MTMPEPTPRPPLRWNVCPDCLGRHESGAACLGEQPTSDLSERLDAALRTVGLARNLAAYRDAVLPVVEEARAEQTRALAAQIALYKSAENDVTDLTQRAEQAERQRDQAIAALTHHAAEAHRRKWRHDGDNQAAFDALHRLGDEILASRDRILAALDPDQPKESS